MKVCPQCHSTDVPDGVKQCPYCLYRFEEMKKADSNSKEQVKNTNNNSEDKKNIGQKSVNSDTRKNDVNKPQSIGKTMPSPSSSSEARNVSQKKSSKKWIALIIVVFVLIMIIKSCSSNDAKSVTTDSVPAVVEEATPTPEIEEEEEEVPYVDEYVLPYSDSEYLTEEDLRGLSKEELRFARNEIYARHGRRFNDSGLQNYFDSKTWYDGTISPEDFTESYAATVFNQYELANKDFIANYENTH